MKKITLFFVVYGTLIFKAANNLIIVLKENRTLEDIFKKKNANILFKYYLYNYTIDLKDGA